MIDLVMEGKLTKVEIAKQIQCSRQALYDWLEDDEVKAEMDKRLQGIRTETQKRFTHQLKPVVDELYNIALHATGARERKDACIYLINRVLGTPKDTLNISDEKSENIEDILAAFNKIVSEEDEEDNE